MKFIRFNIILFALMLMFPLPKVYAELPMDTVLLKLTHQLLSKHPELESMATMIQASKYKEKMNRSWMNPMVRIEAMNIPSDHFTIHQEAMTMFQLGFMQKIPLNRREKYQLSKVETSVKEYQLKLMQSEMKKMLWMVYYELLALKVSKNLLQQALNQIQQMIQSEQLKIEQGKMMIADYYLMNVEKSKMEQKIIENDAKLQSKLNELQNLLQDSINITILPIERINEFPVIQTLETIITGFEYHPEVLLQKKLVEQSLAEVQLSKNNWFPELEVMLTYSITPKLKVSSTEIDPHTSNVSNFSSSINRSDFVGASLSFPIPLWYQGNQTAMIKMNQMMLRSEEKKYQSIYTREYQKLFNDYAQFESLRKRYEISANTLIPSLRKAYEQTIVNYQNGMSTLSDLFRIQMDLTMSQMDQLMLIAEGWILAHTIYERVGK